MQKFHRNITLERFDKFTSTAYFADVNLRSQLFKRKSSGAVSLKSYAVPDLKRMYFACWCQHLLDDFSPFEEAVKGVFVERSLGDKFGPSWSTHWIRVTVTIPADWQGESVSLIWDADNEAMVWTLDGMPLQGLTGGDGWDRRCDYILTESSKGGEIFEFYLEMACNGMFGVGQEGMINAPDPNRYFTLKTCEIVAINKPVQKLFYDFEVIAGMAKELPADSQRAAEALIAANAIINAFKYDDSKTWTVAYKVAEDFLKSVGGPGLHQVTAIGHCHIDTAWLWSFDETKRKCARSWTSQIDLMKRFPTFKFACSQAQQFEWLEKLYPQVFAQVREFVKSGQFVPIGGTWVEMDCNIPSGEAFVRQFLYGQRYFEKAFGKRTKVFWLPDTFGYAAQLPQIIKLADMQYFLTQKLSWNNINKFPHTTFYWVGLDGTRFPPADSYNSQGTVKEVLYCEKNHKDKLASKESLYVFGNGDGGGGPLAPMIERMKRMQNLNGLPNVNFGDPNDFFKRIEKSDNLVQWRGELYFELHRGTYTSQARNKWYNRKCELLLRDLEYLAVLAKPLGFPYPKAEIDRLWKLVLLCQFHDVLPGSSIEEVYVDSVKMYVDVETSAKALVKRCVDLLCQHDTVPSKSSAVYLLNTTGFARNEVIEVDATCGDLFSQLTPSGKGLLHASVDAFSSAVVVDFDAKPQQASIKLESNDATICENGFVSVDGVFILENDFVSVRIDLHGRVSSFYDKVAKREVITPGELGNRVKIYDDVPLFWDAWDVEVYHLEKGWDAGMGMAKIHESGPLRVSIVVHHPITETSTLVQTISLTAVSPRLDFETSVDWLGENRKFLKVEFPFDIQSDFATYETAFGWVQRPTHFNTSWDVAKFEVCAHRFADLSEYGYGVALLNDSKYGYATHGSVMRLSLLRAPKAPDAHCDLGRHVFKYALFPHTGTFTESTAVVQEAYKFNVPIIASMECLGQATNSVPKFKLSKSNVVLDTVKRSENDDDSIIVRMYEAYGGRCEVKLSCCGAALGGTVKRAWLVNLLEDVTRELEWLSNCDSDSDSSGECVITMKPFEIVSVKLEFS